MEDITMEKIRFVMNETGEPFTSLCRQALEQKGVEVTVCEKEGEKALKSLLQVRPQVALLDAFMPGLDAITIKQRYEEAAGSGTVFLVMGTFQSEQMEGELMDSGFAWERVYEGANDLKNLGRGGRQSIGCAPAGRGKDSPVPACGGCRSSWKAGSRTWQRPPFLSAGGRRGTCSGRAAPKGPEFAFILPYPARRQGKLRPGSGKFTDCSQPAGA